jgi:hypothetical protein
MPGSRRAVTSPTGDAPVSTCVAERGEPGAVITFGRGLTACDSEWLLACTAHNHHPAPSPILLDQDFV